MLHGPHLGVGGGSQVHHGPRKSSYWKVLLRVRLVSQSGLWDCQA